MQIGAHYSHLNGLEWLEFHRKGYWDEIKGVVTSIDASLYKTKSSHEKSRVGELLYSPTELNKAFCRGLEPLGWQKGKVQYFTTDDPGLTRRVVTEPPQIQQALIAAEGRAAYASSNEVDFLKERVAIEVQLGKYPFIAYDIFVKHLAFYVGNEIDCGIEILPMKVMQQEMSSGPGYYEWALYNIMRQGRGVPAVPLVIIGIAPL
jgi:hypothetical protein